VVGTELKEVKKGKGEDERCFIDGGQAWEPVKAARRALSPKGRVGVDANPAGPACRCVEYSYFILP